MTVVGFGVEPKTFDGTSLQTDDWHFQFVEDSQTLDSPGAAAIKSTRPGRTPQKAYVQPDGIILVLEAVMDTISQDNYDALCGLFDTLAGEDHTLVVTDGNSVDRQIACIIQKLAVRGDLGNIVFAVSLDCPSGIWLSSTAADDTPIDLDNPADTFTLTNNGNTNAPLALTISPQAAIDHDDGYAYGRRIWIANRSEQALTHFAAEGYAIDITDGGLDTATLNGAGKVESDLSDLRAWLNGRELERWCSPDGTTDSATKIWCNLAMRPGKFATLSADLADDGDVLVTESIDGFIGWDNEGWVFIEDEPCVYSKLDDFTLSLTNRPNPSAHSAGADVIWIEHVLTITYGFTNAGTPDAGTDSKPVIDLAASSNTSHKWTSPFFNATDRRSMTWRRIVEGDQSGNIRGYDDGSGMVFEDLLPVTSKPLADQVEVRFPVPMVGPLLIDRDIDLGIGLHGYATDLQGYESLVIEKISGSASAESYSLDNEATRLRLKAFISAILGETGPAAGTSPSPFAYTPGYAGPGHADDSTDLYATARLGIHFTLDQDTDVLEFAIQTDSSDPSVGFQITSEDRTELIWVSAFTVGSDGDWSAAGWAETMPAGSYYLVFDTTAGGNLIATLRSKARIFDAYLLLPNDYSYEDTGLSTIHFDANGNAVYNNAVHYPGFAGFGDFDVLPGVQTPLFMVISTKQAPQSDAPLQTGNQIVLDNIVAPLDDTRSPKILVGSEFSAFPLIGTLTNNDTEQAVSISHICKAGEGLELDFDGGLVTDTETGLAANYAIEYSDPIRRIQLRKGDNEFEIAIVGVSGTAELEVVPTYRHAWV